ncbi:unnamed protein product [Moneuplotes crassus]|uniref:RING-type domain-containing protein n=1 Tax=Euplotes crassus TaxID=5936 RepID=A0AAD1UCZ5_EUPCR|nr:unnamed protein product [Moneuplotes crassus]
MVLFFNLLYSLRFLPTLHCLPIPKPEQEQANSCTLTLEPCLHNLCKDCLLKIFKEGLVEDIECPQCLKWENLDQSEEILKMEDFQRIRQVVQKRRESLKCPCGEEGKRVDCEGEKGVSKDVGGMSEKMLVMCETCDTTFCGECKVAPYHAGKTCEEHKIEIQMFKCRFCSDPIKEDFKEGLETNFCSKINCIQRSKVTCQKFHKCGHPCLGFADEEECLACLHPECVSKSPSSTFGTDQKSSCGICLSPLEDESCVQLSCNHIFHEECIKGRIQSRWTGLRISFNYKGCPTCSEEICHASNAEIIALMKETNDFEKEIIKKSIVKAKSDGYDKDPELLNSNSPFYKNLEALCMDKFCYYECYDCKTPYFGGLYECAQMLGVNQEDLLCYKCSAKTLDGKTECSTHGSAYIEFKCKFCCNLSVYKCSSGYYCEPCHASSKNRIIGRCVGPEKCLLKVPHKDNGTSLALGCGICRNRVGCEI